MMNPNKNVNLMVGTVWILAVVGTACFWGTILYLLVKNFG